jgi:superfamily II DNA helicase RecQ
MSYAFFWIPAMEPQPAQEELNRFLASHRVMAVERQFVTQASGAAWSIAVEYAEGAPVGVPARKGRVDYRELLDPATFVLFDALRKHRRRLSESEGVPPYAIFTDEQLAAIARRRPTTLEELRSVQGIGDARGAKYGAGVLDIVRSAAHDVGEGEVGGAP